MFHIEYDIHPDENNVIDGRKLAGRLIKDAHRLAAAYVDGSLDQTERIFNAIVRETLHEIHAHRAADDRSFSWPVVIDTPKENRVEAFRRHAAVTKENTAALLEVADEPRDGEFGPLPASLDNAHREIERLREDCAAAYQCSGVLARAAGVFETGSVERLLDNLWAASNGATRPHDDLLPYPHEEDSAAFERSAKG